MTFGPDLDPAALTTLEAAVRLGTFEAAARELHVTPSAISQRIKAQETRVGRVLLTRTKPVQATPAGQVLLRLASQWDLLQREAVIELTGRSQSETSGSGSELADAPYAQLPLVVNADSLADWFLPALAAVQARHRVVFEVLREDEAHSTELLRQGRVLAAVSSDPRPVQGCRVVRLGAVRYLPVATPGYVERWLPNGPRPADLGRAPMINFDRRDTHQEAMLRRLTRRDASPPTTFVPGARDFAEAVRHGLGWGMVPQSWIRQDLRRGTLVTIAPRRHSDVVLHWQHWKLASPLLDSLTEEVLRAAVGSLRQ